MTYTPIKPDQGPSPLLDAPIIQTNFAQFASIFSKTAATVIYNHTALNQMKAGTHQAILLQNQTSDPGVTQDLTVLYARNAVANAGTQPQLFVQVPQFLPNSIPNTPLQLTTNTVNTSGPVYQSFLYGGYLFYFGTVSSVAAAITLSPAPTKILVAMATANTADASPTAIASVSTNILTNSTFMIYTSLTGVYQISWMAIAQQ